jgi:acyl-CoA synthetase (AMP-forming)/AMP-acid ligase II
MIAIPPVDGLTIGAALRRAAARHPNREALVFRQEGFRATYAEHDRQVDEVARALTAMDLRSGDHVAAWAKALSLVDRSKSSDYQAMVAEVGHERLLGAPPPLEIPRQVAFVDDFPLSMTGKVQKYKIREVAIREPGLERVIGSVACDNPDQEPAELAGITR